MVVATHKIFETRKQNNWITKDLMSLENKMFEYDGAINALHETFYRVKEI